MKLITIVGARPQFIKAAAVSRAIEDHNAKRQNIIKEIIVHTGQHYDANMSQIFFDELNLPQPHYNLEIADCSHGAMTGRMLERIENLLIKEKPDLVLIYGDTNSTLAGALAAVKLHIPIAHVEAGLRSFNNRMPEEINRIIADRISSILFCPTETAVRNLEKEGIKEGVMNVGDVMYDVSLYYREKALTDIQLNKWGLEEKRYALCTIHRAENTDEPNRLKGIASALSQIAKTTPVILPLHPRTRKMFLEQNRFDLLSGIKVIEPLSYLEMIRLEASALAILTDSGGVQKEAYFHQVQCLTLRDETEWVETLELGWNQLCGADEESILTAWSKITQQIEGQSGKPFGDGRTAELIVDKLSTHFQ
jgi:UDP-GlcNAc3NAcA epimerase